MKRLDKINSYLREQRWCNFKAEIAGNKVRQVSFKTLPIDDDKIMAIGCAEFEGKDVRHFMMPLKQVGGKSADHVIEIDGIAYKDATEENDFWPALMSCLEKNGNRLEFSGGWVLAFEEIGGTDKIRNNKRETSRPLGVEQSNTTVVVGDGQLAFKLERMLAFLPDENPEFEMNKKLMREKSHVMAETYGILVLYNDKNEKASSGIIQEFVRNKGDMWNYSVAYLKEKLQQGYETHALLDEDNCSEFMALADKLGRKTQEMLDCLSQDDVDPRFAPQRADASFLRAYGKQMEVLLYQTKRHIVENVDALPEPTQTQTRTLLKNWDILTGSFVAKQMKKIEQNSDPAIVCRVHGDFHLGQVLVTKDNDLKFTDFAGEPALPVEQRKQKHIAVRDYAGMYRSLNGYLGAVVVEEFAAAAASAEEAVKRKKYARAAIAPLINKASQKFLGRQNLNDPWLSLEVFRKNLYEVNYEVCNRPQMAYVPIAGLNRLFGNQPPLPTNGRNGAFRD